MIGGCKEIRDEMIYQEATRTEKARRTSGRSTVSTVLPSGESRRRRIRNINQKTPSPIGKTYAIIRV